MFNRSQYGHHWWHDTHRDDIQHSAQLIRIVALFHDQQWTLQTHTKKKSRGVNFGEWRGRVMGSPIPDQWSGSSLSRRARTWREKWDDAPSERKTVCVFLVMATCVLYLWYYQYWSSDCCIQKQQVCVPFVRLRCLPRIDWNRLSKRMAL
jgi:hypothetical protein